MPISDGRRGRGLPCLLRLAPLGLAVALSGCLQAGESLLDDELARVRAVKGVGIVSVSPERALIAARGNRVAVAPAPGSCIAPDSVEEARQVVFLVVSDCVIEQARAVAAVGSDAEEIELPPAFPGVVTVSVSGERMDRAASDIDDALTRLQAFLQTPEGRGRLGRGDDTVSVEVEDMRVAGETLYVHVRETGPGGFSLLSDEFWRAFVEINDRLVLATVSGFRDNPMDSDAMLRKLTSQISAIRAANGTERVAAIEGELPAAPPPERDLERPTRIAPFMSPDVREAPGRPSRVPVEIEAVPDADPMPADAAAEADDLAPVIEAVAPAVPEPTPAVPVLDATRNAPASAPSAPRRPRRG